MSYIVKQGAPGSQVGGEGEALTGRALAVAYSAASQLASKKRKLSPQNNEITIEVECAVGTWTSSFRSSSMRTAIG